MTDGIIIKIFIIMMIAVCYDYHYYHLHIIIKDYGNVVTNPFPNCCLTLVKLSPGGEILEHE